MIRNSPKFRIMSPEYPFLARLFRLHGSREDVPALEELCRPRSPRVILAAVEALERLDPDHLSALVVPLLRNPNPAVQAVAIRNSGRPSNGRGGGVERGFHNPRGSWAPGPAAPTADPASSGPGGRGGPRSRAEVPRTGPTGHRTRGNTRIRPSAVGRGSQPRPRFPGTGRPGLQRGAQGDRVHRNSRKAEIPEIPGTGNETPQPGIPCPLTGARPPACPRQVPDFQKPPWAKAALPAGGGRRLTGGACRGGPRLRAGTPPAGFPRSSP